VGFSLSAREGDLTRVQCRWDGVRRDTEVNVPTMSLAEGLARVMARPERGESFERAWTLAKAHLEAVG
jgi:glucose-6-phosphate dehydrogenase assembly protein OpcA